ncbi:glycosyltransferase [Arenimonas composti]|uniref:Glycosyltransferase subfamily 4-like N-terminal domain-containing protein n=1 Tax=Arenimonas composti TR7-09 = DSM 18010 TaxID=1121013 RepID=A0A091B8A1_9GAMM|nr:glycosyltransferase [Arenimonas composti]KFN48878.1 hypothetical protein P873_13070 [Arenimonas composti TR7-09 = DSM 18010]
MLIYVAPVDISLGNGPGVNEREFVHALARRFGDRARVLLPRPRDPAVLAGLPNVQLYERAGSPLLGWLSQWRMYRLLRREIRRQKPQAVIMRIGQLQFGLAAFARRAGVPIVMKTQGDPSIDYLCRKPGLKGWVARRLRPFNLRVAGTIAQHALAIDCCTPQLVRRNLSWLPGLPADKVFVVDNATNVESFQPGDRFAARARLGLPRDAHIFGYVGGVPWERGGMRIVRAVAALRGRFPDILGVVVGGAGEGLERMRALARELGVEDRCRIVGHVPYDDVPLWVRSFDVGVAMDLPERGDVVGSSNQKIRQYIASGKPVVAAAGINAFIGDEGLGALVDATDQAGFDRAVGEYLGWDEAQRQAFAAKARRYAEEHLSIDAALAMRLAAWRARGLELAEA